MSDAPEPHEIFRKMREEGRSRLTRSRLELAFSSLVAGFDIVFGVIALAAADAAVSPHFGVEAGHLVGALAFGIAFIFIAVGRSELFTENFMVPLTGLKNDVASKIKLAELWLLSPVFNIVGGTILILIVTTHGVLPSGSGKSLTTIALRFDHYSFATAFTSAIAGGALITLMTWLTEASPKPGGRILVAWIAGSLLTLGSFDHVIVVTIEMIFGIRFGAAIPWLDVLRNFGIAAAGNMLGGLAFVTLTRTGQAIGSRDGKQASA
ncbi:MAG: formate/nitrite transporter family protein [Solirubrobacteraceae bacterium]